MLKNPAYKGQAGFGKTHDSPPRPKLRPQRGHPVHPRRPRTTLDVPQAQCLSIPVPALISADLFAAVEAQLAENRARARQRQRGARYLLQGLVVCAQCQYAFYGKPISHKSAHGKARHYAYYRCIGTDAYRFGGERICDNLQVRTDFLDAEVWQAVCDLLQDPKRLQPEYQRRLNTPGRENQALSATQAQLTKLRQATERLIDRYTDGLIDKAEFEPRLLRLRQRRAALTDQARLLRLELARQAELRLIITRLEAFAAQVQATLADADWATKRDLIRTLVKRVEIGKDEVTIVFRVTPDPFDFSPQRGSLQHRWGRNLTRHGQSSLGWSGN
jgi:site-specific DNA recombinase